MGSEVSKAVLELLNSGSLNKDLNLTYSFDPKSKTPYLSN